MAGLQSPNLLPLPPGNLGLPVIGETLGFAFDSDFAKKRHQQYGDIFKTRILGNATIYVRGGEANRFILTNENKYFVNSLPPPTKALLGNLSLSVQVGAKHQNRRRLLYQAFQHRSLSTYVKTMEGITQYYIHEWAKLESLTWYPEIRKYTFDIACKFLIGIDFASQTKLGRLFETWSEGLFSISLPLPWTKFGRALHSRQQLLQEIETIICQRQKEPGRGKDVLSFLLQGCDDKGNMLSLEELKDQLLMLLFAGHETLTSALASFCLLLSQHPNVLERCRAEQKILGESKELTLESLQEMIYLEQVIREVVRLIPPVAGGFKKVICTCDFNGYQFPQGWNVIYGISPTHRNPLSYSQPDQFNPDRFLSKQAEEMNKSYNYIPFGGGIRECLGKEFARLEMKLFAACLVRNCTWELLPYQNLEIVPLPVPHPQDGLKVSFKNL